MDVLFYFRVSENSLQLGEEYIRNILYWSVNRIDKLSDLVLKDFEFVWVVPTQLEIKKSDVDAVQLFKAKLKTEEELKDKSSLNVFLKNFCKENEIKFSNFMKLLRSVLSGLKVRF